MRRRRKRAVSDAPTVQLARAAPPAALATSDLPATHVPLGTTVSLVGHAPHVMTVRLVMTAHLARIVLTAHHAMNLRSVMDDLFAKDATLIRRASSTVRLERHAMTAVTTAPSVTIVPHVTTAAPLGTTVSLVGHAPLVMTVRLVMTAHLVRTALTAVTVRSVPHVTIVVMTAVLPVTTEVPGPLAPSATTVPRAMTVRLVATRTFTRRETTRPSTNPATTLYSSAFRQWQPRRMTSMA